MYTMVSIVNNIVYVKVAKRVAKSYMFSFPPSRPKIKNGNYVR